MGIVSGGGYAEYLVVHERQAMRVPANISVNDAAAIPEVFITAWDALVVQGGLTSGRIALVHAGASGVGTAGIQICKAIGARVVVTCSTGKVQACKNLGADLVIDYSTQDFVEEVKKFTGGKGVDTILGLMGLRLGRVPIAGSEVIEHGWRLVAEQGVGRRKRIGTIHAIPVKSAEAEGVDDDE
jgi:NADPH:quinone reductase-like Zn-dependent oxidoreductase